MMEASLRKRKGVVCAFITRLARYSDTSRTLREGLTMDLARQAKKKLELISRPTITTWWMLLLFHSRPSSLGRQLMFVHFGNGHHNYHHSTKQFERPSNPRTVASYLLIGLLTWGMSYYNIVIRSADLPSVILVFFGLLFFCKLLSSILFANTMHVFHTANWDCLALVLFLYT